MQASATQPRRARWGGLAAGAAAVLFVAIQLVPYGHAHANPPVTQEPAWPDERTHMLAVRACFACHSNTTTWPWYSQVAPTSWLVQHDVDDGRRNLDFSEWNRPQRGARRMAEEVRGGDMPPAWYTAVHPEARLSADETSALVDGLGRIALPPGSPTGPPGGQRNRG